MEKTKLRALEPRVFAFSRAAKCRRTFGFSSTRLLALVAGASSAFWASSVPRCREQGIYYNVRETEGVRRVLEATKDVSEFIKS